ncbi:MAG: TIGR04282 family arsenosugar biosynthesis glycosyltransferase, partial [Chloroflexi bacterium]|nr:TIGR04282 family arsenosugar biosynthesis glycosyltransferase [Chloroflexota bacterium]
MSLQNRIVVFSRFPIAGKAKTRLIRAMGAEAAAVLQRDMSGRTILIARVAGLLCKADLVVQFTGARPRNMERWLGRGIPYITASSSDLGTSMLSGFIAAAAAGSPKTLTIGSDCPELDANILGAAFGALDTHDIVIGPASDGGYYLIGMRVPHPALFQGMQWGGINVLRDTLKAASGAALKVHLLPELSDVDLESDLPTWNRVCVPPPRKNGPPRVSVIIPTLNEAEYIEDTLRSLRKGAHEIIVVDGHRQDDTITR